MKRILVTSLLSVGLLACQAAAAAGTVTIKWQGVDLNDLALEHEDGTHRAAADIRRDVAQWSSLIQLMQDAGMFED